MIACNASTHCPYLNSCIAQAGTFYCEHDPLFPVVSALQVVSYVLLPLGLSFANLVGVSGGFLRVIVFMDILAYQANTATYLTYPITLGGGVVTFFILIFTLQKGGDTVVDYILVLILLPSQVVGVIIGNILTKLIPQTALDAITIIFFLGLAGAYLWKLILDQQKEVKIMEPMLIQLQGKNLQQVIGVKQQDTEVESAEIGCLERCKKILLIYKADYILATLVIFVIFQVLSLLAQGKIVFFTACTAWYGGSIAALNIFLALYLLAFRKVMLSLIDRQPARCRALGVRPLQRPYDLHNIKTYVIVFLPAYLGGLIDGLLGSGVGSVIIMGLLLMGAPPPIASAASGYQIVFTGAASIIQAFTNNELTGDQFGFLFILAVGGSLAGVLILMFLTSKLKGNRFKMIILIVINTLVAVGVFPNAVFNVQYYGWAFMNQVPGFGC